MDTRTELSFRSFTAPKFWPYWLLWGMLRLVALLPFEVQMAIGRIFGFVARKTMKREHRIAQRNLELCFPQLDTDQRAELLDKHFESIGISFVEMGIGWFTPMRRLRRRVVVNGKEHLENALAKGSGVLLFGGHCTTLEIGAAMLEDLCVKCAFLFRPQRNPMMDVMIKRGRSRAADEQIPRDDIRSLLKRLKQNYVVMYLPDQTYLGNQSEMLPFFGEPAVTNTATTKLAKISGATVLSYFYRRLDDGSGYVIDIGPPFQGIPSDDPIEDTRKMFSALENHIRVAPEQYLWIYKKFKRRPEAYGDPY